MKNSYTSYNKSNDKKNEKNASNFKVRATFFSATKLDYKEAFMCRRPFFNVSDWDRKPIPLGGKGRGKKPSRSASAEHESRYTRCGFYLSSRRDGEWCSVTRRVLYTLILFRKDNRTTSEVVSFRIRISSRNGLEIDPQRENVKSQVTLADAFRYFRYRDESAARFLLCLKFNVVEKIIY